MNENPYQASQAAKRAAARNRLVPIHVVATVVAAAMISYTFLAIWKASDNQGNEWYTNYWCAYATNYGVNRTISIGPITRSVDE